MIAGSRRPHRHGPRPARLFSERVARNVSGRGTTNGGVVNDLFTKDPVRTATSRTMSKRRCRQRLYECVSGVASASLLASRACIGGTVRIRGRGDPGGVCLTRRQSSTRACVFALSAGCVPRCMSVVGAELVAVAGQHVRRPRWRRHGRRNRRRRRLLPRAHRRRPGGQYLDWLGAYGPLCGGIHGCVGAAGFRRNCSVAAGRCADALS